MVSKIKRKIVKKRVDENLKLNKFDFNYSENYQLEKTAQANECNCYYFTAHSFDKKQSLYVRLENRNDHDEIWFYYIEGNNKYFIEQNTFSTNPPLKIYKEDEKWVIKYSGLLKKNHKDQVRCTLEGQFESSDNIITFNNEYLKQKLSESLINQKNDIKTIESINESINNQVYYEQTGTIKIKMLLEGQHSNFTIPCVRSHIYGHLDWNNINNHLKVLAINEENYLNFSLISSPSISLFEFGLFKTNKNEYNNIDKNLYERATLLKGTAPENINFQFELENKGKIGVHVKKIDELQYKVQEDNYEIVEAIAEFLILGKQYRGIIEAGYSKDSHKWFNNMNIIKYKE